jgi:hypothetical protein
MNNHHPYEDSESNINQSNEQEMQQQYFPFYNMDPQQQQYYMNQQYWATDQFEQQYQQYDATYPQPLYQEYYQNINPSGESMEKVIETALKNMLFKSSPQPTKTGLSQPETQQIEQPSVKKTPKGKKKKHDEKMFKFDDSRTELTEEMRVCPTVTLSKEIISKLNKQCMKLYKELIPTQKEIEKKNQFFERLCQAIKMKWKGIIFEKLFIFQQMWKCTCLEVVQTI